MLHNDYFSDNSDYSSSPKQLKKLGIRDLPMPPGHVIDDRSPTPPMKFSPKLGEFYVN
jgi:hypothetical protein